MIRNAFIRICDAETNQEILKYNLSENYNGMTAEQFVWAWLRSEMLEPKQIKFEPVNIYYEALKDAIDEHEKEAYKRND